MTGFVFKKEGFPSVALSSKRDLDALNKIVNRGGKLFSPTSDKFCFNESSHLGKWLEQIIKGKIAFLVALATSDGGGFTSRTGTVNDIDDLGSWSGTDQGHDFWKQLDSAFKGQDTEDDFDLLESSGYSWDDLKEIKPTTKTETTEMKSVTTLVTQNKAAATSAVKIKAGQALNASAIKALKASKSVPMLMRGYLDHPIAKILVANVAQAAANYSGNAKALQLAELMMLSAAVDTTNLLDVDALLDSLLSDESVKAALSKLDTAE